MRRLAMALTLLLVSAGAWASDPRPFKATYTLKAGGWPQATVKHTLEQHDGVWQSTMFASIKIATGREYGRFRLTDDGVQALDYYSRYRLFGFGDDYRMNAATMAALPDRQTALVELGRNIERMPCRGEAAAPCEFRYLDHKQKPHTLAYRILGQQQLEVPAGRWQTDHIELWDVDKPERRFHFYVAPRYPGLLVKVDYIKEGELDSRMELAKFSAE